MEIIRMLTVKNEIDILKRNITWYSEQGIPTVVIDNGSVDGSFELLESLGRNDIAAYERILTQGYQEQVLLKAAYNLARTLNPDWLLLADADEFYESPVVGESLKCGIERIAQQDYNLVQFHNIEFWMTEKDAELEHDPLKRIRHYSYFDSNRYKAYPNLLGLDISTKIGHVPIFPAETPINLCPEIFISRHYKFRSLSQAYQKIKQVAPTAKHPNQNFHYLKFTEESRHFVIPSSRLVEYFEDKKWLIQRKYDGGRMTKAEIRQYLGLANESELNNWFSQRSLRK